MLDPTTAIWAVPLAAVAGLCVGGWLTRVAPRMPLLMEHAWAEQCRDWLGHPHSGAPEPAHPPLRLRDPSVCPHCRVRLPLRRQVPLLSWAMLGGRCAACRARIGWHYPATELACAVLFALCAYVFGATWLALAAMGFVATLLLLAMIDLRSSLLPDSLTLPLLWAGLLLNASGYGLTSLHDAVWGAAGGYLFLWLLFHAFRFVTGREGMGYGDFKLLGALGAWLGASALPWLLLGASVAGAAVGLALLAAGRVGRSQPLPFGPYLALGGLALLFLGGYLPAHHG